VDQDVTTVFLAAAVAGEVFDWVFLVFFNYFPFRGATVVDLWFVANCGRGRALEARLLSSS
jgi:hypothetical protein